MTSRLAKLAGKTVSPYAFLPGSLQLRESRSKAGDGVLLKMGIVNRPLGLSWPASCSNIRP
jgi:hypothetical protein